MEIVGIKQAGNFLKLEYDNNYVLRNKGDNFQVQLIKMLWKMRK